MSAPGAPRKFANSISVNAVMPLPGAAASTGPISLDRGALKVAGVMRQPSSTVKPITETRLGGVGRGRKAKWSRLSLLRSALCTPRSILLLLLLNALGLVLIPLYSASKCPALSCEEGTDGFFWDHSKRGHLSEKPSDGPDKPGACIALCRETPECAYWMYDRMSNKGMCKLWAVDQSPCESSNSRNRRVHFHRSLFMRSRHLVGGPCRQKSAAADILGKGKEGGGGDGTWSEVDTDTLMSGECPSPIACNAITRGFLFDHPHKGHLQELRLGPRRRPSQCFMKCRSTPSCSFWMFEISSKDGYCKMWSLDQSPCEPLDPFDASTANYVKEMKDGRVFVVGGNCHKLPPMKQRVAVPRPPPPPAILNR